MKIVFLTLFLFITLGTYAHQDMIMSFNRGNIHFKYKTGYTNFEIGHKVNILTDLSTKLLKSKGYTTDIIYFYFEHDYTNRDSSFLALGYGQFAYWKNDVGNSTKHLTTNGLKINIRDRGFDIYRILNLINSAIKDVNLIKTTQEHFIIDLHSTINGISQFDTFFSIPTEQVNKYLSSSDSFIERLVNEKTYRNLEKSKEIRGIDYYYQNNKFHFYNTRQPDTKWSQEQKKHIISKSYGEDILVVDNILEIFGNFSDGHFVFINDSVFYYIPQLKDKIKGPLKIENVRSGRPPIRKYLHEYNPINRFILFIDNYVDYNKAIYFPDSNLVISNFEKLEKDFINGILKEQSPKHTVKRSNIKLYILFSVLMFSIIISMWQLRKNKK